LSPQMDAAGTVLLYAHSTGCFDLFLSLLAA
jgi:hypothetical protein